MIFSGAPTRTRTWNLPLRRRLHYPVVLWARRARVWHKLTWLFHDVATLAVFSRDWLFGPNLEQLHNACCERNGYQRNRKNQ